MDIVFDLGGVVVDWNPRRLIARHFALHEHERVMTELIGHADWLELDRGTLDPQEAIRRAVGRCEVSRASLDQFFQGLPASLVPLSATLELIQKLKGAGHRLFVLSNMHVASIEYLESHYDFWNAFDGAVVSSRIHLIKPEPAIYLHLIERFSLVAHETLFIDDVEVNLEAARAVGLRALRFENAADCLDDLTALGYLPLAGVDSARGA